MLHVQYIYYIDHTESETTYLFTLKLEIYKKDL